MIKAYKDLSSLDGPGIFDNNKDQKHILSQLIHSALKDWDERHKWYAEWKHLTI